MKAVATRAWIVPVVLLIVVLLLPALGMGAPLQRQATLIVIYALVTSGLNLTFGFAGQLALGQVAVMAAGAYVTAILGNYGVTEVGVTLAASILVALILGFLVAIPGLRLSAWSLGLVSFFLVLLIPGIATATREVSGGLQGIAVPIPTLFGLPIGSTTEIFYLAVGILAIWMFVFRNLILSRYGRSLRSLRESPVLVDSLGQSAQRLRLSAFVVGSIPAGVAGCLYALQSGYISPSPFSLALLLAIIAAAVLGGSDSIYGSLVGAAILVIGPLQIQAFEKYSIAIYGGFLLMVGALASGGLAQPVRKLIARILRRPIKPTSAAQLDDAEHDLESNLHIDGELLEATGISKTFGGNRALVDAHLRAEPGCITAIIGSNGAGKTTLLNAVSGYLAPDSGAVRIGVNAVVGLPAYKVARFGVARTFQTPLIPDRMSVEEVALSGALRDGRVLPFASIFRLPRFRRDLRTARETARDLLAVAGLLPVATQPARSLPLGSRRLLEVVRAVSGGSRVILLDEPAAGLDDQSLEALAALLVHLKRAGATIVLIEHNVPFVLSLADTVYVMELGSVLSQGSPDDIRSDQRVLDTYLGKRGGAAAAEV